MKKRFWLIAAVLAVTLFAGVVLLALRREPSYQGRRLTSWMEDLLPTALSWNFSGYGSGVAVYFPPGPVRVPYDLDLKAREAIGRIGTNGLPTLVRLVRREDSPLGKKVLPWLK